MLCGTTSWFPQVKWIKDVRISPNGQSVLFVVTEVTTLNNKLAYLSRIYKKNYLKLTTIKQLDRRTVLIFVLVGPRTRDRIAFLSDRSGYYRLHLMDADGEQIQELHPFTRNIQTFKWSPDGTKIAFVMADEKHFTSTSLYGLTIYKQPEIINRLWLIDLTRKDAQPITCIFICSR